MSVVKCKNCGKEIIKKASICPYCGVKTHPIRDIVKIVIIVLVVILVLVFGLYVFSGGLSKTIEKAKEEAPAKKFYGTWELVSYNDNIAEYKPYDTIEIKKFTGGMYEHWYIEEKDYIQTFVSDGVVSCFKLDNDYLIQENCEGWSAGYGIMEGTELKYKKVK